MIRPLTPDDADELAALYVANRDFLAPFEPVRPERFFTVEGQAERIAEAMRRAEADQGWTFAILDDGALAGTISLANVVRLGFQNANVGYWVDRRRNGRGLASAAVAETVAFAFEEAGLHRVDAGTLPDNLASQRVLAKNGFERIGLARRYLLIAGEWRDHVLFERLSD